MRRIAIALTVLAMLLVSAIPAFAGSVQDVDQSIDQYQSVTGDVEGGDATAIANDESDATATGGDASVTQDASQSAVQYSDGWWWWWW